jgi:hypothetical protein
MKFKEMQEDLIEILNKYQINSSDLINKYIINPDTFIFLDNNELSENDKWDYYIWVCKQLKIKIRRVMRSSGIDSDGGRKMKVEGHQNEILVADEILNNLTTTKFKNILNNDEVVLEVICDGIKSKKVDSIIETKKTTPKNDVKVKTNQRIINLSVKKSEGGQVHINEVKPFIDKYEKIYSPIPNIVKDGLLFLFSGHNDIKSILNNPFYQNELTYKQELHHQTLTIQTMNKYNPLLSIELLSWVKNNIKNIAEIVFKRGWAQNKEDWGEYIYYRNKIDENKNINDIINIDLLISMCNPNDVKFGTENGGTTINLPFGSLQYHLGGLQFHHNYKKILKLVK